MNLPPDDRPAILISAHATSEHIWRQVLLGIEEESIPWRWQQDGDGDLAQRAWQAAARSPLLVGLACNGHEMVVHYRNLPAAQPLFRLRGQQNEDALRRLGNNAARLVKGLPFK
ncbi:MULTISPECIES: glycerol dehydratase reactivase beta/small subunit family protein [unclassified Brenneria]|uniref:glycerol dehydratase reactivase beta/small subunit family protein n=1 Tax=unclassified Brenneria TaxID=2634434 RepID=UPI00155700D9|nr:glycerol dehydratase reactivase beta/small subunit family protein [Brenneria sp. hezel4-2-4]MEE3651007.1 glycerol dehydratase reactivase beta/small subunit family protein [Brenneria sp. HEZEL_4_2_4]NPD00962.1 propanediol dehydratase [Brenneria sp. hezel4-2-4]